MSETTQPPRRNMDLRGEILGGRFLLEEKLGKGGMAWVYRATHTELGGDVAIKILFPQLAEDKHIRERFLREARIQYRLQHPHIVRVLELLKETDIIGFAAEYCEGGDLQAWLQRHAGAYGKEAILRELFLPILDAMQYAHEKGLVHRDLKPENILLYRQNERWSPKVTDFGIAKQEADSSYNLTATGNIMGTLHYMSPEQLHETRDVDQRTDIYSLGVILYRILADRLPFEGKPTALTLKILGETPPDISGLSEEYMQVLLRCLEKSAASRYESCQELRTDLEEALLHPAFPHASSQQLLHEIAAEHFAPGPSDPHLEKQILSDKDDSNYHSLIQAETAAALPKELIPRKRVHTMQRGETPLPVEDPKALDAPEEKVIITADIAESRKEEKEDLRKTLPLFVDKIQMTEDGEPLPSAWYATPEPENTTNDTEETLEEETQPDLPQKETSLSPEEKIEKSPYSSSKQSYTKKPIVLASASHPPSLPPPAKNYPHPLLLAFMGAALAFMGVWLGSSWNKRETQLQKQQALLEQSKQTTSSRGGSTSRTPASKRQIRAKRPRPSRQTHASQGSSKHGTNAQTNRLPPSWALLKEACPDGWKHGRFLFKRQRLICHAPDHYKGPCHKKSFFSERTKRCQWSLRCHAAWKGAGCLHPPWVFQDSACPDGWAKTAYDPLRRQIFCQAPTSYKGSCPRVAAFSQNASRCSWSARCGAHWKTANCHIPAWVRSPAVCPEGWGLLQYNPTYKRVTCQAPNQYSGPCARTSSFSEHSDRCSWSLRCRQPWKTARCPYPDWIDQPDACPKDWKIERYDMMRRALICRAPFSYKGPCSPRSAFHEKTDRCGWAVRCKVSWGSQRCRYPAWLFSYGCPDRWELVDYSSKKQRATCHAPPSYDGPCAKISHFTQESQRCTWSKRCGVPWRSMGCDGM
ncbi:MAG: protein kinase [Myxococcales bacterium]|nr:protein kinase [Myxococcales bacterium]